MNTPGPWVVKFGGMAGDEYFVIGSRDGDMICDSHPLLAKDRIPHDARLIAAGPELLDALRLFVGAMEKTAGKRKMALLEARSAAEAAIFKARGS